MNTLRLLRSLRTAALACFAAVSALGTAHAGLVTGAWDPQFGPALPNLSWQVRANWLVPNGCSNAADGVYSTTAALSPCLSTIGDPVRMLSVWVRWFNTAVNPGDPNNFFQQVFPISAHTGHCESVFAASEPNCGINSSIFNQGSEPLIATSIRVEQAQIVGFATNAIGFATFGWPSSAGNHSYDLSFTTNGPAFECTDCVPPVFASTTGLDQFLVTYTSNDTSRPKFTLNGDPAGARLNGAGVYLGQSTSINGNVIPEPGALVLALTALAAFGVSRRRTR